MLRSVCVVAVVLVLGGCGRSETADEGRFAAASAPAPAPMAMANGKQAQSEGTKLAYTHHLSLETRSEAVKPRFEQLRDARLSGAIRGCVLLRANIMGHHPHRLADPAAPASDCTSDFLADRPTAHLIGRSFSATCLPSC